MIDHWLTVAKKADMRCFGARWAGTTAYMDIAGGAGIFAAVIVIWLVAIAYGYYTRRGSAIHQRAHEDESSEAPGAQTPSSISADRSAGDRLVGRRPRTDEGARRKRRKARDAHR